MTKWRNDEMTKDSSRTAPWRETWVDLGYEWRQGRRTGAVVSIVRLIMALARLTGQLAILRVRDWAVAGFGLRHVAADVTYSWRRLRSTPGFVAIGVLTLGLGIGANTVLFSLVNSLVLSDIPGAATDTVVGIALDGVDAREGRISLAELERVRASSGSAFSHVAAWTRWSGAVSTAQHADVVVGEIVTGDYFDSLGIAPRAGSFFDASPDEPGVLISERLWRRWFNGAASAVGTALNSNRWPFTIVGVVPDEFRGTSLPSLIRTDVWFSETASSHLGAGALWPTRADERSLLVMARLRPGVDRREAHALLSTLRPDRSAGGAGAERFSTVPLRDLVMPRQYRSVGLGIGSGVLLLSALVLVIACANLANLFLARGAARQQEVAIRLATGATRWRVLRLLVLEVVLVVGCASVVAWGLAIALSAGMSAVVFPAIQGLSFTPAIGGPADVRVFTYMLAIACAAVLVAGWVPARRAARTAPAAVFGASGSTATVLGRRSRFRTVLVATQVGVSVVLLLVAGLFVRSSLVSLSHDPGYDTSRGAVVAVDLELHGLSEADGARYLDRALAAARDIPGVTHAALYDVLPVGTQTNSDELVAAGQPPLFAERGSLHARFSIVTEDFFSAVKLPLLRGRVFSPHDRPGAPLVAIVNERLATRLWPGQDPIGQRIELRERRLSAEVIGLVADTDDHWPDVHWRSGPRASYFFVSARQLYKGETSILVHGTADPETLVAPLQSAIRSLDPSIAVFGADTLANQAGVWLLPTRIAGAAFGTLGVVGWAIALIGLYGVVSYLVSQRTREIGLRVAMGATPWQVRRTVLREATTMMLLGAIPGLLVAAGVAALVGRLLFGISPYDPVTFVTVPVLLYLVGLAATLVPARRAARLDPTIALRQH